MAKSLTEPNADAAVVDMYNRGVRTHEVIDLDLDQKYAVVLLKLNNAVTPGDYPALGAAINAIAGIQGVNLIIDHRTRAAIPADHTLKLVVEAHARIEANPVVIP